MRQKSNSNVPNLQPLIERRIDLFCGGGLSLLIAIAVIVYGSFNISSMDQVLWFVSLYLATDLLINSPHFMASYRILYSRRTNFRKYPFVTIVLPALAIALLAYLYYWAPRNTDPETTTGVMQPMVMFVLGWLAPVFLGWHYMGQSWGTTACFAYLSGFRMNPTHRRLIRFGFLSLFAYHLTWACATMQLLEIWIPQQDAGAYLMKALMSFCRVLVLVSFFAGIWGFYLLSQEQKRSIPATVWLPWMATYSWYVMVDIYPQAFFLLQIFHALQYLMFPARVEINEHRRSRLPIHMLVYYAALVTLGYIAFEWTQVLEWVHLANPSSTLILLGTATMMIINIHHYFIDAVIWKLRDPEVRESLFGHLDGD